MLRMASSHAPRDWQQMLKPSTKLKKAKIVEALHEKKTRKNLARLLPRLLPLHAILHRLKTKGIKHATQTRNPKTIRLN